MKSLISLIFALIILLLLAAMAKWLYDHNISGGSGAGHMVTGTSEAVSLTLENATHFVLTVTMKSGVSLARFQIAPGKSETRSFSTGIYKVEGSLSDPQTDPFSSQWTFEKPGTFKATFARDGQKMTATGQLMRAGPPLTNPGQAPTGLRPLQKQHPGP